MKRLFVVQLFISLFFSLPAIAQESLTTVQKYPAEEAFQGVAVDSSFFYAIASKAIGKYDKQTGKLADRWQKTGKSGISHLDSGVIVDGKLYAAHSNYPEIPMTSSVEIWNTRSLEHIDSHSFGIRWGSLTWVDYHNGYWWGVFAHYDEFKKQTGKDNRWTTLVQFDKDWHPLGSWVFPKEILEKFDGKSCSGGSWGPNGSLYISGHDRSELYVLEIPDSGSALRYLYTITFDNEGQGIAWDRSHPGVIYGIRRSTREVIIAKKAAN